MKIGKTIIVAVFVISFMAFGLLLSAIGQHINIIIRIACGALMGGVFGLIMMYILKRLDNK